MFLVSFCFGFNAHSSPVSSDSDRTLILLRKPSGVRIWEPPSKNMNFIWVYYNYIGVCKNMKIIWVTKSATFLVKLEFDENLHIFLYNFKSNLRLFLHLYYLCRLDHVKKPPIPNVSPSGGQICRLICRNCSLFYYSKLQFL